MSIPDLSKLSFAELTALMQETNELIAAKRSEELKVLVDGWARKAAANGFSVQEVLDEFAHYLPKSEPRPAAGKTVTHRNPANPAETYAGKGPLPGWLKAAIAAGKSKDDFKV
jgi:DNA-binding protein H-NS